ncbi:hypothetical protein [Pontibacter vulgaris]|uniref:hypothetical protein n=1 Tax=Pontibacter vulgaris TaxID=2905679 RepID=UPI001FA7259F|nr:hypothetical protein [Pontibacter vulgaris]
MKTWLVLLLLLSITFGTNAQALPSSKATYYNWVYLNNSSRVLKGMILATNDSSVQFVNKSFLVRGRVAAQYSPILIPISVIEKIKSRKRNSLTYATLLGAAGGVAAGALIGYAQGDDVCGSGTWCIFQFSAEEKARLGAVLGVIPGLSIGLLLGSSRQTIHINGNLNVYSLARDELKKYTLTEQ